MSLHELIGLKPIGPVGYEIFFKTKLLGTIIKDIDGFYYFKPQGDGYWSDYALRLVADSLEWLNSLLEEEIKNDLDKTQ